MPARIAATMIDTRILRIGLGRLLRIKDLYNERFESQRVKLLRVRGVDSASG